MSYAMRVVLYDTDGSRMGVLPDLLEADLSVTLSKASTLKFKYPRDGERAEYLTSRGVLATLREIAVEVTADGREWVEPVCVGRFMLGTVSVDLQSATDVTIDVECSSIYNRLTDVVTIPTAAMSPDDNGAVKFTDATPGAILLPFIEAAQDRGWAADMDFDFTTTTDSQGNTWSQTASLSVSRGQTMDKLLTDLTNAGVIDWRLNGRTLQVYNTAVNPGASSNFLNTAQPSWTIALGAGVTDAEDSFSWASRCSAVIVEGEASEMWTIPNPYVGTVVAEQMGTRYREVYMKAEGVTSAEAARHVAEQYLIAGASRADTVKRQFTFSDLSVAPLTQLRPGTWVSVERADGYELMRLTGMTLSWDGSVVEGDLTLGTFRESVLERLARISYKTDGGILTSDTGGSPSKASETNPDAPSSNDFGQVVPAQTVVTAASGYSAESWSTGTYGGYIDVTFNPVTTGTGRTTGRAYTIECTEYQVRCISQTQGAENVTTETAGQTGTWTVYGVQPGATYTVQVRAYYFGAWGAWSTARTITVVPDTTAPPQPSVPAVVSQFQAVQMTWDTLDYQGGSGVPSDFDHLGIAIVSRNGALTENYATGGPGEYSYAVASLPEGDYDLAIRSYDKQGNVSPWSGRRQFTVEVTVDAQAIQSAVDDALAPYEDTIGEAVAMAQASLNLAENTVIENPVPPDAGIEDVSVWKGPDGKWWILRTLVEP